MKQLILSLLLICSVSAYSANDITLDDVVKGSFHAKRQMSVTPLPDGEHYACLANGRILQYGYRNGKQTAVLFDPSNTVNEKIQGAEGFIMSPDGQQILIATNIQRIYRRSYTANWYIYNIRTKHLAKLSDYGPQQSPVWSPDGNQIAFVRDNNIHLIKLLYDNAESQVTKDGERNKIINGIPDWVNEEEFALSTSLCFTADGSQICWIKYDESGVATYDMQMYKGLMPEYAQYKEYPGAYSYKYPKAGTQNAKVSAWSFDIKSKKAVELQVPVDADGYICRLYPTNDPQKVLYVTLNRHQDKMCVYAVNPRSTVSRLLINEEVGKYVTEAAYTEMQVKGNSLLMLSDRDGYRHLYLYNLNGTLLRSICPQKTDITAIYGYDEKTGNIYYQAAPTPQTRHIYVSMRNGKTLRLSKKEGTNDASFSASMSYYFNTWSDRNTPYVCTSHDSQGKLLATLIDNKPLVEKLSAYRIPNRELFSFTTSEGVVLNGYMLKPTEFSPSKKYPVIMHQYSGPGSQQVIDSWRMGSMGEGAIYDAYLCSLGYIVVAVDGRGTGCRGAEFEKCTYMNLGVLEAKDQVETAKWLSQQPYVNKDAIGIWGWSFGGFCTLMAMSEGSDVFAAGVAVAPPTSWRYYDTVYTERFMRTPQENPDGYDESPISRASKLHGKLLICHGTADDNVHVQNTYEYSEALVQADKDFRQMIYTNRNHSIYGSNTRRHLLRQVTQHFEETLK